MKDFGVAKQILGMKIIIDRVKYTLRLSQVGYVKRVLNKFNMDKVKIVGTLLGSHFKFGKDQLPKSKEERDCMSKVS